MLIPFTIKENAGFIGYTAARHQGAFMTFGGTYAVRLYDTGLRTNALLCFFLIYLVLSDVS